MKKIFLIFILTLGINYNLHAGEKYKNSSEKLKKHVGMYGYNFSFLKKYMSLNQTNSELSLSLEQMRFHENDYFFNGYEAIIDPGVSIDSPEDLDNYIHHNE